MMHLKAQAGTGFDLDALDLEPLTLFKSCIGAPRAMNRSMQTMRLMAVRL